MRELTPEQMGINYEALLTLIGRDRALDLIGLKRVVAHFGMEELLQELVRCHGIQEVRQTFERLRPAPKTPGDSVPS